MADKKVSSNHFFLYFIALGAFALGMSSYITAGLIPLLQADFAISIALTAQLVTAFTLAYGIGSPLIIALIPDHKQRLVLLLALLFFVLANLISALASSFLILLLSRILAGIGAGVYLAVGIALSTSIVAPEKRAHIISIIMSGMAAGTVLGVPVGLIISNEWGWRLSMYMIAILAGLSLIGLYWKLPNSHHIKSQSIIDKIQLLKDKAVLKILLISLIAATSSLGLYTYLFPLLNSNELGGVQDITLYLWIWGLGGILGSIIIGYFSNFINNQRLTAIIMLILGIVLLLFPILASMHPLLALIPIAIWGAVGWALQIPQNDALLASREHQGGGNLAVALNESALYLGSALGSALGGLLIYLELSFWFLPFSASFLVFIGFFYQLYPVKTM